MITASAHSIYYLLKYGVNIMGLIAMLMLIVVSIAGYILSIKNRFKKMFYKYHKYLSYLLIVIIFLHFI